MPTTPAEALSPLHRRNPKCHDLPRHLTMPLDTVDCIVALNSLPTTEAMGGIDISPTDTIGRFSMHADPATHFRLPRHFAHGSCMIGVTMVNTGIIGDEDTSSWNRIAQEALVIIRDCVQQLPPQDKVGGSGAVGALAKVQVDLFRNQPYLAFLVDVNKPPAPAPAPRPASPGSTS